MIGASVRKRNVRRTGVPATSPDYGPTVERLLKSAGNYTVGDDQQGGRIHTMRDQPLDRMYARQAISGAEYAALQKYHHHWHHAGLEMSLMSADLNRIFASDPGSLSGMAKTEAQAHHRKQWRDARALLGRRAAIVVDSVVCAGNSLEVAGYGVGYSSPYRARGAAAKHIQRAGDILRRFWGIG